VKRNTAPSRGRRSIPIGNAPQSPDWPLIFISHDSRDARLAEAFELLLADASGGMLKAFRSSDRKGTSGIQFGATWYDAIMSKLDQASDVVALLTPRSIERPWILYEVGVAKGKFDHTAFGLAIGIPLEAITGPFAQFQNCGDDEESLTKLVIQLLRRNPTADPRPEAVGRQVVAFRDRIAGLHANSGTSTPEDASLRVFEEVKAMFEVLPSRLLTALNHRVPSLVDPIGPHWHEWIADARTLSAGLWSAAPSSRAKMWGDFALHIQEYIPRLAPSSSLVSNGLAQGLEATYRTGMKAFENACSPYFESPSKIDQDAARVLRSCLDVLRHWLNTQPWRRIAADTQEPSESA